MSLEHIKQDLLKRANKLSVGQLDTLNDIKFLINQKTKIGVRVLNFKNNVLKIAAEDSVAASELRLQKIELKALINKKLNQQIKEIVITVR